MPELPYGEVTLYGQSELYSRTSVYSDTPDTKAGRAAARRRADRLFHEWEAEPKKWWAHESAHDSSISYDRDAERLDLPDFEWPVSTELPRESRAMLEWQPPWATWELPEDGGHGRAKKPRGGRKPGRRWPRSGTAKIGPEVLVRQAAARGTSTRRPRAKAKNRP